MSSDERPEKGKQPVITRSKQSRRKMLKSMAAGSGAVIAGKSMPNEWAKPMVNSVLLPAHAQTSLACSVGGSVSGDHITDPGDGVDAGLDATGSLYGPFTIPGDYTGNSAIGGFVSLVPSISVTPGVTDGFNLTTDLGVTGAVDAADLNQNVTPDPTNGTLAFNTIISNPDWSGDLLTATIVLTPDNTAFCGGPQVIDITFGN